MLSQEQGRQRADLKTDKLSSTSEKCKGNIQLYLTHYKAKALANQSAALTQTQEAPWWAKPLVVGAWGGLRDLRKRPREPAWWWGQEPSRSCLVLFEISPHSHPRIENMSCFCQFSITEKKIDGNPTSKPKRNTNNYALCWSREDYRRDGFWAQYPLLGPVLLETRALPPGLSTGALLVIIYLWPHAQFFLLLLENYPIPCVSAQEKEP